MDSGILRVWCEDDKEASPDPVRFTCPSGLRELEPGCRGLMGNLVGRRLRAKDSGTDLPLILSSSWN